MIPHDYVGRKVEVIVYATDEPEEVQSQKINTMAAYKGILTSGEAEQLQEYVKKSREEWNRIFDGFQYRN